MSDCQIERVIQDLPVEAKLDFSQSNVGGWILLGIVLAILIFELWLIKTNRPTISQWIQRKTKGRPWWKLFGIISIGLILWHLFEGGPL